MGSTLLAGVWGCLAALTGVASVWVAAAGRTPGVLCAPFAVCLYLSGDDADAPEERAFADLRHKGNLTDTPEGALTRYAPLEGDPWGRDLSHDVLRRFCESLEGAPEILAPIETPAALLDRVYQAVPKALHTLAMRSLLSGLIKLQQEGKAREVNGRYELV